MDPIPAKIRIQATPTPTSLVVVPVPEPDPAKTGFVTPLFYSVRSPPNVLLVNLLEDGHRRRRLRLLRRRSARVRHPPPSSGQRPVESGNSSFIRHVVEGHVEWEIVN